MVDVTVLAYSIMNANIIKRILKMNPVIKYFFFYPQQECQKAEQ